MAQTAGFLPPAQKKTGKLTREVETRTEPRIVVLKIYPIATDIVGCVHGNVAAKFPYPNFFEMYASYFADLVCRTHYPGIIPIEIFKHINRTAGELTGNGCIDHNHVANAIQAGSHVKVLCQHQYYRTPHHNKLPNFASRFDSSWLVDSIPHDTPSPIFFNPACHNTKYRHLKKDAPNLKAGFSFCRQLVSTRARMRTPGRTMML
jgi:hypothetical protein